MQKAIFLLVMISLVSGCQKSDPVEPALTTVDGEWTYATPDGSMKVDFGLKMSDADLLTVLDPIITVDKVPGNAFAQLTNAKLPTIESLRINANDAVLVQPYSIMFSQCVVSADFTRIQVENVEYTFPWGQIKKLTNITITRKS